MLLDIALRSPSRPHHHPTISIFPVSGTVETVNGSASGDLGDACPPDFVVIDSGDSAGAFPNPSEGRGNQVSVEILDDDIYEGDEKFEVQIKSATGAELAPEEYRVVTVEIAANDDKPFLAFVDSSGARVRNLKVKEDVGEVRLTVGLLDPSRAPTVSGLQSAFSVSFDDGGGTTEDQDYESGAASGLKIEPCTDVSELPEFTFTVVDDNVAEPNEWFALRLITDDENAKDSQITVTIEDND